MAVTYQNTANGEISSTGGTVTIDVGSGDNRCLFIGLSFQQNNITVTGVTYAGSACAFHDGENSGVNRRVEIWKKVAPSTGSNNIAVSYTGIDDGIICGATAFNGVDQTTPMGAAVKASGSSTAPSVEITITSGNFAHDVLVSGTNISSPSQTQSWLNNGSINPAGAGQRNNTSGVRTFSWTIEDTTWATVVCEILAVASATIEQEGFRFRNDDGSESAATWKANQDTNITLAANTAFRLRFLLKATGNPDSIDAQAEARVKPSGGAFGAWGKIN